MLPGNRLTAPARGVVMLLATAVFCGLCTVAGCAPRQVPNAAPPLRICGTTFYRGAEGLTVTRLGAPDDGVPPAPDGGSRLPRREHGALTGGGAGLRVIAVTGGCARGRTVVVSPASAVRVRTVARDGEGGILAFSLVPARPRARVRVDVYAYDGRRPTGRVRTAVG
ncbi:hypothetical protein [Streptomyces odontomachi]|uniref:hypothetical protein n=1 Tax=Streptomyces odontomachi TaxID=2944940 RepID=UPI0021095B19|nr:hypothetical protein [Streptomyces sp. ODS25]